MVYSKGSLMPYMSNILWEKKLTQWFDADKHKVNDANIFESQGYHVINVVEKKCWMNFCTVLKFDPSGGNILQRGYIIIWKENQKLMVTNDGVTMQDVIIQGMYRDQIVACTVVQIVTYKDC